MTGVKQTLLSDSFFVRNDPELANLDGVNLEFYDSGNPDGIPILLVHGFPDSPVAWQDVLKHLDTKDLRIIAPYLRGCGRSSVLRDDLLTGQLAALAHDLLALMAHLQIDRFHLVGHDWGARASYAVSLLSPESVLSLTALGSPYVSWAGGLLPPAQVHCYWYQFYFQIGVAETMLTEHSSEFCRELWKVWSPTYHFSDTTFAAAADAWRNPQFVPIVLDYYRLRWKSSSGKAQYADLQAKLDVDPKPCITVQTIFIQGENDGADMVEGAAGQEDYFTAYDRCVLENVGHFPHRENPERVAQEIIRQVERNGHRRDAGVAGGRCARVQVN